MKKYIESILIGLSFFIMMFIIVINTISIPILVTCTQGSFSERWNNGITSSGKIKLGSYLLLPFTPSVIRNDNDPPYGLSYKKEECTIKRI